MIADIYVYSPVLPSLPKLMWMKIFVNLFLTLSGITKIYSLISQLFQRKNILENCFLYFLPLVNIYFLLCGVGWAGSHYVFPICISKWLQIHRNQLISASQALGFKVSSTVSGYSTNSLMLPPAGIWGKLTNPPVWASLFM